MHTVLPAQTELFAREIVDIAFKIHTHLGPGLLESVYEKCFCYELMKRQIPFLKQQVTPIVYEELLVEEGLRLDIIVNDEIIIELKAQENYHPVWQAQILSYLKLSQKKLGFLINFHTPLIKNGIKRIIL